MRLLALSAHIMNIETINGLLAVIASIAFISFSYFMLHRMWKYALILLSTLIAIELVIVPLVSLFLK
jgi:hypothetical protein